MEKVLRNPGKTKIEYRGRTLMSQKKSGAKQKKDLGPRPSKEVENKEPKEGKGSKVGG